MRFLRGLGLFVTVACLVWVGVLWRWQVTRRDMSTEDILLYLVALPVTLFLIAAAAIWAWRGASARLAASQQAASAAPTQAAPGATDAGDAQARRATVQVVSAHAACGAGNTLDELLDAASAGTPAPELDDQLRDMQGLPVMVAKSKALSTDEVAQQLEPLVADTAPPPESLLRALALLEPLLAAVVDELSAWPERLPPQPSRAGAPARLAHRIRVLPTWPAGVSEAHRAVADTWLNERLRSYAEGIIASEAWLPRPGSACSGPELWQEADLLLATLARERQDDLVLLTACHSDLDAATVDKLEGARMLFCSAQPKGVIPGEGAAVVVLAGPDWPAAKPDAPPAPHLHRPAIGRRDKPVDAAGRISAVLASELLRQAAIVAGVGSADIAGLASDADQHSARGPELHAAALEHLEHLDPSEDHCMLGHLSGRIGAVATLATVAMAARRATATGQPWAALSVADPHWRLALLARPEAPPAPNSAPAPADAAAPDSTSA